MSDEDQVPFVKTIAKPEWVEASVSDVMASLQLIADKRLPEVLVGQFLHTCALRLLRCVYGSDLETAVGVRDHVLRNEQLEMHIERKLESR